MKTIQELLQAVQGEEIKQFKIEQFKEVMDYCQTRVTADEGIPTVIGLDDLTREDHKSFKSARDDEGFNLLMAVGAMIFASLYEDLDPDELGGYPAIAPAMSAMTEMFFRRDREGHIIPYREVIKDFLGE